MKQHPVDDLFARKLNEHSLEPKRATWDEMQKRLHPQPLRPERRIGGIWWYAAAASVLLTLFLGQALWQEQEPIVGKNYVAIAKPEKAYENEQSSPKVTNPTAKDQIASVNNTQKKDIQDDLNTSKNAEKQSLTFEKTPQVEEEKLLAQIQEPVEMKAANYTQSDQKQLQVAVAEKLPVQNEPTRTLIVQLDEPIIAKAEPIEELEETVVQEQKKKRLRLGRLIRQFNNLREGEPLNLKDAGIDPSTIIAKASDKVHDGKEKIGESYEQLRSRTFRNN